MTTAVMPKVVPLPFRRPASTGASWWQVARGRLREHLGKLLSRASIPGAIADASIDDPVSRQRIEVHVGALFTRLTVDGRDYYFDRLTGEFNGAGENPG